MDRYLRNRRRNRAFELARGPGEPSWWDALFSTRKNIPHERFTPEEEAQLHAMETEIKQGEAQLEHASPAQEPQLEAAQEQRVSLYQQFVKLFRREHQVEAVYEQFEHFEPQPVAPVVPDTSVTDDFRTLASIQVRWFERMPTRIREEFKESEDYPKYVEILQRRGVARKK